MMLGKMRTISGTFTAWASALERFSWEHPLLSDAIFSLSYAAVFLLLALLRIRKRKRLEAEGKKTKTTGLFLLMIGFVFAVLAILEVSSIISTPELIASWFRFQGM
jgi:hypothetical protein